MPVGQVIGNRKAVLEEPGADSQFRVFFVCFLFCFCFLMQLTFLQADSAPTV